MACSAPSPAPAARSLPQTRSPALPRLQRPGERGQRAGSSRRAPSSTRSGRPRSAPAGLQLPLQLPTGTQFHACRFLNSCRDEMKEAALTSPRGRCSIAYSQRHLGREGSWKWLGAAEEPRTVPTAPSGPKASLPSPPTHRFLY